MERERKGGYFGERCNKSVFFFFPFTLPCNGLLAAQAEQERARVAAENEAVEQDS